MRIKKVRNNAHSTYREAFVLIRFSSLGDVMCVFPLLYTLAKTYPQYLFFFVTKEHFSSPFTLLPENVVSLGVDTQRQYKGLKGCYRLAKYLKSKLPCSVFHIIDLHNVLRSLLLRNILKIMGAQKIGIVAKNRSARRAFLHYPEKSSLPTVWERYQKACADIGLSFTDLLIPDYRTLFSAHYPTFNPSLYIDTEKPFLIVAPFAAYPTKIYPADLMEQFLKIASSSLKIYIVGKGEREKAILQEWKKNTSFALEDNFEWRLSLAEEIFCYTYAQAALVMDSANLHLCGMASIPTLSLWGGTSPKAGFNVWDGHICLVGGAALSCHPCSIYGKNTCSYQALPFGCMRSISPELIWEKIKSLLPL